MRANVLLLVFASALAACATVADDSTKDNIVLVGELGQLQDPTTTSFPTAWLARFPNVSDHAGSFEPSTVAMAVAEERTALKEQVTRLLAGAVVKDGRKRLLIHIHGGLNPGDSAVARAVRLTDRIRRDDADPWEPVFVCWRSGPLSAYRDHLVHVRQGEYWPALHPYGLPLAPAYLIADAFSIVGRSLLALGQTSANVFDELGLWDHDRIAERRADQLGKARVTRDEPTDAPWYSVAPLVVSWPLELPMSAVLEGTGAAIWDDLHRRSRSLFDREADYRRRRVEPPEVNERPELQPGTGTGALGLFLQLVRDEVKRDELARDAPRWEIALVGHSMGAIVINEILREFPDLPVDHIVYMGAACTLADYHDAVFGYMRMPEHRGTQLYHLTLHPESELGEQFFWPLGALWPRGSLLVQIDSYYSRPEALSDRTAGRWSNLMSGEHLTPPELRDRIWYHRFGWAFGNDERFPSQHGSFDAFEFWRRDFWTGRMEDGAEQQTGE